MKHGDREKPFLFHDNLTKKHVIMVEEHRYDAGYDDFYSVMIVLNTAPTPEEIFKYKLTGGK